MNRYFITKDDRVIGGFMAIKFEDGRGTWLHNGKTEKSNLDTDYISNVSTSFKEVDEEEFNMKISIPR